MSVESATAIRTGLELAQWNVTDLWVASIGIGGSFAQAEVEHIADGSRDATQIEHDILAAALNEHLPHRGAGHPVRYWDDLHRAGDRAR